MINKIRCRDARRKSNRSRNTAFKQLPLPFIKFKDNTAFSDRITIGIKRDTPGGTFLLLGACQCLSNGLRNQTV